MRDIINTSLPDPDQAGFFARLKKYWTGAYRGISVARYEIETSKLAANVRLKIAVVSDIHGDTRFMPQPRIAQIVEMTNALGPDIIHLGGDLSAQQNFAMRPLPLEVTIQTLSRLHAPLGAFAVMGNHDWWDDRATQSGDKNAPEATELLREAGIRVLSNQSQQIVVTDHVWVSGLESQMAFEKRPGYHEGADDLKKTLRDIPSDALSILFAHEPDIFAELNADDPVDLVLSGHTHGGQVRVFGQTPVVPSKFGSRFAHGLFQENGKTLIVSAGLGCSKYPLRFGVMPEIVEVTLRGQA